MHGRIEPNGILPPFNSKIAEANNYRSPGIVPLHRARSRGRLHSPTGLYKPRVPHAGMCRQTGLQTTQTRRHAPICARQSQTLPIHQANGPKPRSMRIGPAHRLPAVTVSQIIGHYRRDHAAVDLAEAASAANGSMVLDQVIHRDQIRRAYPAIDGLPPAQRLAMRLRFSEDRSCADVGRIMGKSDAAVKLLIYRAVRRLRQELADQG